MTEQFSKLNKLSHSFNTKRPIDIAKSLERRLEGPTVKPVFTLGSRDIEGNSNRKSSDSSGEEETSSHVFTNTEDFQSFVRDQRLPEAYMPTVGIVMGVKSDSTANEKNEALQNRTAYFEEPLTERLNLIPISSKSGTSTLSPSPQKTAATTPEIMIQGVTDPGGEGEREKMGAAAPPSSLNLSKNISHSSGEVDNDATRQNLKSGISLLDNESCGRLAEKKRSNSEQDLTLNITSSQSESALKSIRSNIVNMANVTSPVAVSAKDILSPFSKFAKGVQNFGANLDPRKLKQTQPGLAKNLSDHHLEERQKLQEKWGKCKSRLIAL